MNSRKEALRIDSKRRKKSLQLSTQNVRGKISQKRSELKTQRSNEPLINIFGHEVFAESFKNWFMLSVRISSYGCTREVWRAREKRKSCSRPSREQL